MNPSPLPMFPLGRPCLPGEVLPLQIFEARYVAMLRDLMSAPDPQFGVVLIDRGSEVGGGDVRRDVGTRVSVAQIEHMGDHRYGVAAIGMDRIRVREWLEDDPYPRALVEDWPFPSSPGDDFSLSMDTRLRMILESSALSHVPLEQRVFTLASMLPIGPLDVQRLLEADSVLIRDVIMGEILDHLEELARFGDSQSE